MKNIKKIILVTLTIISSFQTVTGQEKNELDLITSGKWYLESFENDGEKKTYSEELKENNWMRFHSDGKHEVMSFSYLDSGEWQLSNSKKKIKMINKDRESIYEIITVNENKMILKRQEGEIKFIMAFKK
tara:strand:- start:1967 stop:2356 length:390 start_codon:yes stop_codon:yes gene_type:complete